MTMLQDPYANSINDWADAKSAEGLTANTVIDSNDEPPGNNQQCEAAGRCYYGSG
eukprot:CAMPEP_0184312582 /NCGR_PEP_ID=MMETSP1049-20130417/50692_1 /TAXON_ID=77928 /ORGANISM="Proteomonas sulcata, Strain CCMP704" /LENGTH=54 /DNA_ID=CAMNT_0026628841 /DNA_START=48 /DNA_END=212 /DNA_ORIENTATION=-